MNIKKRISIIVFIIISVLFMQPLFANSEVNSLLQESSFKYMTWAFILGGFSAFSLVLGSLSGLIWKPSPWLTAAFTAFGAGALLAALSIELIAPTVTEFVEQSKNVLNSSSEKNMVYEFSALIIGCIAGGIMFYFLNEALESKGGYLRKVSTTISYFNHIRKNKYHNLLHRLSAIKLFRSIPDSHLELLVHHIKPVHIKSGKYLFHKGDMLNRIYIIDSGEVEAIENNKSVYVFGSENIIGENSLLQHTPATYDAIVRSDLKAFELSKNDFAILQESCPELQEILEKQSHEEIMIEFDHTDELHEHYNTAVDWTDRASKHLHSTYYIPSQKEINQSAENHNSAPLSIWLGLFLDGIPESFVIGAGFLLLLSTKIAHGAVTFFDAVPYTLIAGLFISNFPEALSSSIGMKNMGWKTYKILMMWTSLMLMAAIGAVFGYSFGTFIPGYIEIGLEGLAAGAMLTMIAQTMIPEAVHIGGSKVTGLSTLAGYLSAVAFKILE